MSMYRRNIQQTAFFLRYSWRKQNKEKHLRAVNYCSWLTHLHSCIPLPPLCFSLNTSHWFQRREVRRSPCTHPQKLRFRLIKEGCICYKVMMKPPRGSLEFQCFQRPWMGCALRILHLLRLLISEFSPFPKQQLVHDPVTALKRQTRTKKKEICVIQSGTIKGAGESDPSICKKEEADLQIKLWTGGAPSHLFQSVNTLMWCMAACSDQRKEDKFSDTLVFTTEFIPNTLFCWCHAEHRSAVHFCSATPSYFPRSWEVILPWWFWFCCQRSTSSQSCQGASCIPPPPGKAPSHTTTSQLLWMLQAADTSEIVMQVTV